MKRVVFISLFLLCTLAAPVLAQQVPLQIGSMYALQDEFGNLLHGTHPDSLYYGVPYVEGDLVHVYQCNSGIFPPNQDGASHFANPLLFITRIGVGTAPLFAQPALFSDAVLPRPSGDIFIRVFNAPNLEDATFYVDSHIHHMSGSGDAIFRVEVTQTVHPIDPNDDDGDGLNNSWELSYGSNVDDEDSDDDGVSDGLEHMAGTDLLDQNAYIAFTQITPSGEDLVLQWMSAPGKQYRVEAVSINDQPCETTPISSSITATNTTAQFTVTNGLTLASCYFRVSDVTTAY